MPILATAVNPDGTAYRPPFLPMFIAHVIVMVLIGFAIQKLIPQRKWRIACWMVVLLTMIFWAPLVWGFAGSLWEGF